MRLKVADITMDLSNSMGAIAKSAFPKAVIIRDCFHVIQRCGEGIEEIRLRLKREAIKEQKKEKAEFRKKLERLAKQRKAHRHALQWFLCYNAWRIQSHIQGVQRGADGAVSRQLGTYAHACDYHHTAICKERANTPKISFLSMGEEKAGAYESMPRQYLRKMR